MFKSRPILRRRICAGFVVLALGMAAGHSQDLSVAQPLQGTPGEVTFHGRYQHSSGRRALAQPSELWIKQSATGGLVAMATAPFVETLEMAAAETAGGFTRHELVARPGGKTSGFQVKLEFLEGKALLTRQGLRTNANRKELPVPARAWFDPNSRPDLYCAANLLVRLYQVQPSESKEFQVFDWDNTGEGLAPYRVALQNLGKDKTETPAGTFEATHYRLTQKTSADTWFKKRAGHLTDFWVLDNYVIVRILRSREPYEVRLLDYDIPTNKLPGQLTSGLSTASATNAADMVSKYQADWTAFVHEVEGTYPFFELKGIRADWEQAKPRFAEAVRTCKSDHQFVGLVTDAMRLLRDAHMGFSQLKAPQPDRPQLFYPGISFMPATQGRVVVMAEQAQLAPLKPGTIVTRIDGRNAREVLEAHAKAAWGPDSAYPVFVSSPQRARLFAYRWPLLAASNCTHQLHYLAEGQERELTLTCATEPRGWPHTYNAPTNLARAEGAVSHTQLASGAGYIYLRSVAEGTPAGLRRALAAHPGARGWILDLRGNGGGGYDTNLLETLKTIPQPVVALLDAGCISAGETLARDLAQLANAHLIGSRTAGASSSKRQWTFPSGLGTVTFSTRSRWRADGQPIEFNGIQPDEEVEAVPEEVARGLNSELLRAEEYLARKR